VESEDTNAIVNNLLIGCGGQSQDWGLREFISYGF
jgi:hypothetical protein